MALPNVLSTVMRKSPAEVTSVFKTLTSGISKGIEISDLFSSLFFIPALQNAHI
jgi:hypothetical protein